MYNKFTLTKLFFPSCPNEPTQVSPEIKTLVVNISHCKERIVGRHDQRKSGNDEFIYNFEPCRLMCVHRYRHLCIYMDTDTHMHMCPYLCIISLTFLRFRACYSTASRQKHLPRT